MEELPSAQIVPFPNLESMSFITSFRTLCCAVVMNNFISPPRQGIRRIVGFQPHLTRAALSLVPFTSSVPVAEIAVVEGLDALELFH